VNSFKKGLSPCPLSQERGGKVLVINLIPPYLLGEGGKGEEAKKTVVTMKKFITFLLILFATVNSFPQGKQITN
jgi:hypothetical protein